MRVEEAKWINSFLKTMDINALSPMLDLGSSTKEFREVTMPHIYNYIFRYLENEGVEVIHFDQKKAPGVDMHGDFFESGVSRALQEKRFRFILCANMLEHVDDPKALIEKCLNLLSSGGLLLLTVPYSYPYHPDTIDSMFRPGPDQLAELVPSANLIHKSTIVSNSLLSDVIQNPVIGLKLMVRLCLPFLGFKKWVSALHRLTWLFRPYKITAAVFVKQ